MHTGLLIENLERSVDRVRGKQRTDTREPKIPLSINVAPELYDRLGTTAQDCGVSLSAFCRQAIEYYLGELGE